jgi:hypothetical protein
VIDMGLYGKTKLTGVSVVFAEGCIMSVSGGDDDVDTFSKSCPNVLFALSRTVIEAI